MTLLTVHELRCGYFSHCFQCKAEKNDHGIDNFAVVTDSNIFLINIHKDNILLKDNKAGDFFFHIISC